MIQIVLLGLVLSLILQIDRDLGLLRVVQIEDGGTINHGSVLDEVDISTVTNTIREMLERGSAFRRSERDGDTLGWLRSLLHKLDGQGSSSGNLGCKKLKIKKNESNIEIQ